MEPNINSDNMDKPDDSHIYQEIEDLYIDDTIPSNLDSKCRNNNFPEPFYFDLILNLKNAHVRGHACVKGICTIKKSKDIFWHTYISNPLLFSII